MLARYENIMKEINLYFQNKNLTVFSILEILTRTILNGSLIYSTGVKIEDENFLVSIWWYPAWRS